VKAQTVKVDGKKRTTDERVSRADVNGKLSESSRTVGQKRKLLQERKAARGHVFYVSSWFGGRWNSAAKTASHDSSE
jgi:hypothetical protein